MIPQDSEFTIRTVIIDDEPVACELLDWMLRQDPDIQLLDICKNGRTALKTIQEKRPDLIFLDIQMPDMDGFSLLRILKTDETPYLIFVTAYEKYAIGAFDVQAVDYLLKPFNLNRLKTALRRAKDRIRGQKKLTSLENQAPESKNWSGGKHLQRLEIRLAGRVHYVPVTEILWIQAADQYADIHCRSGSYLVRMSLAWLQANLDPQKFVRIHRSVIVHVAEVREAVLDQGHGKYLILENGKKLRISRRRHSALRKSALSSAKIR